jgi:hypothetical protein
MGGRSVFLCAITVRVWIVCYLWLAMIETRTNDGEVLEGTVVCTGGRAIRLLKRDAGFDEVRFGLKVVHGLTRPR